MDENRFDQILDFLCSGIMSKKEREKVKDELYDHLMTKYEINLAVGMDEEKAADEAINALGNRALLRENLSKVHSYYPTLSLKKAMTLLIVGYLFMTVHINFFDVMQQITTFIGEIIFLVGMFCFRTANKNLKSAFALRAGMNAVSVFSYGFNPLFGAYPVFNIVSAIAEMLFNALSWLLLYKGLKILAEPYKEQSSKPLRFGLCTFISCVPPVGGGIIILLATRGENTNVNFTSDDLGILVFPLLAIILVAIFLPAQLFLRINKLLYASDHEYRVVDSSGKKFAFSFALVALSLLITFAGDFAYVSQKAETTPHTVNDIEMSDEEYKAICNGLLSYDIPQSLIDKLPKSEIANYRGIVNANKLTESQKITVDDPFEVFGSEDISGKKLNYVIESYIVRIKDENGMYARFIRRYTYVEPENSTGINYYVDGISIPSQDFNNFLTTNIPEYDYESENGEYNNDFLLILSEENGKLYKNEPLAVYDRAEIDMFPYRGIAGFEYEAKEGLDIIYATSYNVIQYESISQMKHTKLIHRSSIVPLQHRTVKALMDFGDTLHHYSIAGYDEFIISTWFHVFNYENEEQNAEYYDETSDVYATDDSQILEPTTEDYQIY